MKYSLLAGAALFVLAACDPNETTQSLLATPTTSATTQTVSEVQGDVIEETTPEIESIEEVEEAAEEEAEEAVEEIEVASNDTGALCLATDVLANDLTFLDEGTQVTVSGNSITANGSTHDVSGVSYSTKPC